MSQILQILTIYFDSCCYGRPQDDQTQLSIAAETIAIGGIIDICNMIGHSIIGSAAVKKELSANPDANDRIAALTLFEDTARRVRLSRNIKRMGTLHAQGLGVMDSIHLATAETAYADFLLTVDKDFEHIATSKNLSKVRVLNPFTLLQEVTK
jgi:predicted nucleic acid-binding protein